MELIDDPAALYSLDALNKWLMDKEYPVEKVYEETVYIEGDFSNSVREGIKLRDNHNNNTENEPWLKWPTVYISIIASPKMNNWDTIHCSKTARK